MPEINPNITELLRAAGSGERGDIDALMTAIYADLRRMAESQLRGERADHTLQPTALVHEAYLKLVDQRSTNWNDRAHFFAVASRVIRRILVDHARKRNAEKRGKNGQRIAIEALDVIESPETVDFLALDQALEELAELDARQAEIVELRFFGGLSLDEVSVAMSIPPRSVDRHWAAARAWLFMRLSDREV